MDRVMQSIMVPSIVDARVIPNGVDLSIFHPADRRAARAAADLPQEAVVLLVVANGIRCNTWKDYPTLRAAFARLGDGGHGAREVLVVVLGEAAPPERAGRVRIRFVPYQEDPTAVANFYQAADLYVHAARADTFPTTVLEALACGTPVVATAVGGIPEQVRSMTPGVKAGGTTFEIREATGVLVQPGDSESMAGHIENLLTNSPLRDRLAQNASRDARDRFGLDRQVDTYLDWYEFMFRDFHTALKKDMRVLA
jgi:glycosyltransferase involved in cell wall biosynthesis